MKDCENCDYTDIADWEQDARTGKATPVYWCERYKKSCSYITYCKYKSESKGRMTFDEALHHLYTYSSTLGSGQTTQDQHEEAKRVAIDIIHKYQKIEQIVDAYITDNPREPMYDTEDYMQSIREVLEDGNDD